MGQQHEHRLSPETLIELETRYAEEFPDQPNYEEQSLADRVRRCLSWMKRAIELTPEDTPPRFVDLWIGLNALYGSRPYDPGFKPDEKRDFLHLFRKVMYADRADRKVPGLAKRIERRACGLIENPHLWYEFWRGDHALLKRAMEERQRYCAEAYESGNFEKVFAYLFERLYILRNQIMHGSSSQLTTKSQDALGPALVVLEDVLSVFLDVLLTHRKAVELGLVPFPGKGTRQYPKSRH